MRNAVIANPIRIPPGPPAWRLDACERDHILMVGRFDYLKGADTLLMAFEHLVKRRPAARLTLVGPDSGMAIGNGQTIGVEAYAQTMLSPQARERVVFTGLLRPEEIVRLRLKANVTVVASRWESWSYVLHEGFVAGSPMISTDWPGSDEIISHGATGLLTPVGEAEPMANALEWLLSHPDAAAGMGAAGRQYCAQTCSAETVGDQLLRHYEETCRMAAA